MKHPRGVRSLGIAVTLAVTAALVPAAPAHALAYDWLGTTPDLDTASNWTPNGSPGMTDAVTFPAGAANKALTYGGMQFIVGSMTVAGSGYSIDGGFGIDNSLAVQPLAGLTINGSGPVNLPLTATVGSGASLDITRNVNFAGTTTTVANDGTVSFSDAYTSAPGAGGLSITGSGITNLTGALSNSLSVAIAGGTLDIDGSMSDGSIDVSEGASLTGTGTAPAVAVRGTLNPGSLGGPGVFHASAVDLGSNPSDAGVLAIDLGGTVAGTQYDRLSTADINVSNATLDVNVGFAPALGDSFKIVDNTGTNPVVGTFAGLPEGALVIVGGHALRVSYVGGDGNDVTLTTVQAVYFPSSGVGLDETMGPVLVDVYRTDTTGSATVDYTTVNGTASAPADFTATSGTLTFAPGDSLKTISVPLVNDGIPEPREDFSLQLTNPVGAVLGAQNTIPVALYNAGSSLVTWDGGGGDGKWSTAANWVNDSAPVAGDALVFPPGTPATVNNDLNDTFASVNFQAGGYSVSGNPIKVSGALNNVSSGAVTLNAHVQAAGDLAVMTIGQMNLNGGLDIGGHNVAASGAGALSINATANSAPGSGGLAYTGPGTLTVTGANDMGRALAVGAGALVFNATGTANSSKSVATGATITGNGSGGPLTVDGTINAGSIGAAGRLSSSVVDISGATFGVDLASTVAATGYDQLRATSSIDVTNATLALNPSFIPPPGAVFTIVDNTSATPVVGTFNGLAQGATVLVGGTSYVVSYVGGTGNDVTLTAAQTVGFTTTSVTESEAGGPVTLELTRDVSTGPASVHYATVDGTATAPQDYVAASGTVLFANGETTKTIEIALLNDEVDERSERFSVVLDSPSVGTVIGAGVAQIDITDNDGPGDGYWMAATDGGVFAYGGAPFYGSMGGKPLNGQIVDIVSHESGDGYWLIGSDGGVFSYGVAKFHGSTGGLKLNSPVLGGARTTTGNGYWLFAADGGVFAFGDAKFHGSTGSIKLNAPIVDMAATPSGGGYWLFASDGGVFAFGDAKFLGSMGGTRLNSPVLGAARAPDGNGYWMTAADGGVFAFGSAGFFGSAGSTTLNKPVRSIAQTESGRGYWLFSTDGGVFAYGDATFFGSTGGQRLNAPIISGTSNS